MKHTTSTLAAAALAAVTLTTTALAGERVRTTQPMMPPPMDSFYRAGEWQVGVSALFAARAGERNTVTNAVNPGPLGLGGGALGNNAPVGGNLGSNGGSELWGADVDVAYFITRNFGISVEQQWIDAGKPLWDSTFNAILRAPLSESSRWAPYLFGGVGVVYASSQGRFEGHLGGGVEYRFTPKIGTFLDGRYTWVDGRNDRQPQYGAFRAGVRFVF